MRISLNLATNPSLRDRYALTVSAPTVGVALVVLIVLTYVSWGNYKAYRKAQALTAEDARQQTALQQKEAEVLRYLDQPKYKGTYHEVHFVNLLIAQKKLSVPGLFAKVADLLPVDVRLVRLLYAEGGDSAAVRMEVSGKSQEALDEFVSNLEKSPDFANPMVGGIGFDKQNPSGAAGGVTMSCQARYLGATPSEESEDQ